MKYKYVLGVILLLTHISCTEDINLTPEYKKKIVTNCILVNDSIQTLTLTYSSILNQHYYDEVTDASITLYQDGIEVGKFAKTSFSKWQIKHTPSIGSEYLLRIQVQGWEDIEASTTMPEPTSLLVDSTNVRDNIRYFTQEQSPKPYWIFVMTQKRDTIMANPIIMSGDELKTSVGSSHPDCDGFNATDRMVLEDKGTTREHLAYLRINPNSNETQRFYVEAGMYSNCLIVFRTSSEEYDRYMKSSVQKMMVYHVFDDPIQWFDENEIYTNIDNGLGIFAAYYEQVVQCPYDSH